MSVDKVEFNGPPPKTNPNGGRPQGIIWELVNAARSRPGEWASIDCGESFRAHNRAHSIRRSSSPYGNGLEVVASGTTLWVRCVGGQ